MVYHCCLTFSFFFFCGSGKITAAKELTVLLQHVFSNELARLLFMGLVCCFIKTNREKTNQTEKNDSKLFWVPDVHIRWRPFKTVHFLYSGYRLNHCLGFQVSLSLTLPIHEFLRSSLMQKSLHASFFHFPG